MSADPNVPISPAANRRRFEGFGGKPSTRPAAVSTMAVRHKNPLNPFFSGRATRGTTPARFSIAMDEINSAT
jgi:hypothetical protein